MKYQETHVKMSNSSAFFLLGTAFLLGDIPDSLHNVIPVVDAEMDRFSRGPHILINLGTVKLFWKGSQGEEFGEDVHNGFLCASLELQGCVQPARLN